MCRYAGDFGLGCIAKQDIPRLTELGEEVAEKIEFGDGPMMPETAEEANVALAVRYLRNPLCVPHVKQLFVDDRYKDYDPEGGYACCLADACSCVMTLL